MHFRNDADSETLAPFLGSSPGPYLDLAPVPFLGSFLVPFPGYNLVVSFLGPPPGLTWLLGLLN